MKIIISGGWSYGNIGDEAIAASTIYLFNRYFSGNELIYTSYNPQNFEKNHSIRAELSVHALISEKPDEQLSVDEILENLEKYNLEAYAELFDENSIFVMSGGGYFHEDWKSQFVARLVEIEIAKRANAKIIVIGQSIGPVFSENSKKQLKNALNKCDYISVRDNSTRGFLDELNLDIGVDFAPDLAMVISDIVEKEEKNAKETLVSVMPASYSSYVGIHATKKKNELLEKLKKRISPKGLSYKRELCKLLKELAECENTHICFVLSTSWSWDKKFVEQIVRHIDESRYTIFESETYVELCKQLSKGSLTISTKMHPLIISASYGVPTIGVSYNYKVDDYMAYINNEEACFCIEKLSSKEMKSVADQKLRSNHNIEIEGYKNVIFDMFEKIQQVCRG